MTKPTPKENMKMQRKLNQEFGAKSLIVPSGTDKLPLAERLHIYLEVFESGCANTLDDKPELYPECVRNFIDAVKRAVDEEIISEVHRAYGQGNNRRLPSLRRGRWRT
jgi:hypothetical protein